MEDREVISLCLKGQTDKYGVLVERYQRLGCSIAYQLLRNRQDAEDVTQDAFVRVFRKLQSTPDFLFFPYLGLAEIAQDPCKYCVLGSFMR